MSKEQILIIEDDADIRDGLKTLLESDDYQVIETENGIEGLKLFSESIDLVILDIIMPGISGLQTCKELRKLSNVPVLFLTAKAQESDKLIGLLAGGDDYLTKPFSYAELLGRVKALLRRYTVYKGKAIPENLHAYFEFDGIRINQTRNEVYVNGEERNLSNIEYEILLLLMKYPRQIFSAKNLYESVWKEPFFYSCTSNVTVYIRKLRTKIEEDPNHPTRICTVWGKGYRFETSGR